MSNNPVVPTLSSYGWVDSVTEKIDYLLAYFVHSDAEQDSIYTNYITNLQALVQKYYDKPVDLANAIQGKLSSYLERYFPDGVVVECSVSPAKDQVIVNENRVNINVSIFFKVGDKEYNAPHQLSLIDGKFNAFIRENNG